MEGDDSSAPKLRDREKRLQVEASKPRLGFMGEPMGALNPFPRLLNETREKLDNAIRRDDASAKKAIASRVGSARGGKGRWEGICRLDLESKWRAIKSEAQTIREARPEISQPDLAKQLIDASRNGRLLIVSEKYLIGRISKWEKDGILPRSTARRGRKPKQPTSNTPR
jgi:hypothetical protein